MTRRKRVSPNWMLFWTTAFLVGTVAFSFWGMP